MPAERLLGAIAHDGVALGLTVHLADPAVVEAAGMAGYDWVSIVLEHAPLTLRDVQAQQLAADLRGVSTLFHVPHAGDERILPVLNLGAGGIVCSHVSRREQAEALVEATRFPPLGDRGAHGAVRSAGYGARDYGEYVREADETVAIGVVLEDPQAIEAADEILAVPGLTLAFVGLLDLAQAVGAPGDFRHPDVVDAVRHVAGLARPRGVAIGMSPYGYEVDELAAMGASMVVSPATDYSMLLGTLRSHADRARSRLAAARAASSI